MISNGKEEAKKYVVFGYGSLIFKVGGLTIPMYYNCRLCSMLTSTR